MKHLRKLRCCRTRKRLKQGRAFERHSPPTYTTPGSPFKADLGLWTRARFWIPLSWFLGHRRRRMHEHGFGHGPGFKYEVSGKVIGMVLDMGSAVGKTAHT